MASRRHLRYLLDWINFQNLTRCKLERVSLIWPVSNLRNCKNIFIQGQFAYKFSKKSRKGYFFYNF